MILKEIETIGEQVDIVVSDNASTDHTEAMINDIVKENPSVFYHRNNTNLGMDRNADLAVQLSRGEYVLLLGDDDILESGALAEILHCLSVHPDIGIIYSNFRSYNVSLDERVELRDTAFDPIERNTYFADGMVVLETTEKIFAAISGGVYLRRLWLQASPESFLTRFLYIWVTLDILCLCARAPAYLFKHLYSSIDLM